MLAIIPARGGSKGLPHKNVRPLAGLPLVVHSIRLAALCPEIDRAIVSTDLEHIAELARRHGGDVPFIRPPELATDGAPMISVVRHALKTMEELEAKRFESVLLLQPTSPCRLPGDVADAVVALEGDEDADGVVGVSNPEANPYWHYTISEGAYLRPLFPEASDYTHRQQLPEVLRLNGVLYLWRRGFLMRHEMTWMKGRHIPQKIPARRAIDIDDLEQFEMADLMIRHGLIELPWLKDVE